MFKKYFINDLSFPKFIFFTGKGGVGKTSVACATAVALADKGNKVLLVSTDPASNLQDVFATELGNVHKQIDAIPNLFIANLDPEESARQYKESIIGPYRGTLPDSVIEEMEEKLSGSCTVEVSAFNEFANYLASEEIQSKYDFIVFDTAPTGHTLRLLQLPSAWSQYISEKDPQGTRVGQFSGLQNRKDECVEAVETLSNKDLTKIVLVSRPETIPLIEATRALQELKELGISNFSIIINGVFQGETDKISKSLYDNQQKALTEMPPALADNEIYEIPLRSYNIVGVENLRQMLYSDDFTPVTEAELEQLDVKNIQGLINDLYNNKKKVVFMMGKGGVGKTSIAATVAIGLSKKGAKVHLTTTDPAAHIEYLIQQNEGITLSKINEQVVLEEYKKEVLDEAESTMSKEDIDYLKESLKTPCTQEIAVFRAFSKIVEKADDEVVIIDTAPTGHTLLLLDSTQRNYKQIETVQAEAPQSVKNLLPRLRNQNETEVIIITLPEVTPVYEAIRLEQDLKRAGIYSKWWVVNSSLYFTDTKNQLLKLKGANEKKWIKEVIAQSNNNCVVIPWIAGDIKQNMINAL